jgi:Mrp family chromosome partitioning ATPase
LICHGDAILDLIRLVERLEFLIVTTPSLLAFQTVKKQVSLLCELKMPLIGLVENMKLEETTVIALKTEELGIKYLGTIPFDPNVEEAIGNTSKLLDTAFAQKIQIIAEVAIFSKKRET